MTRTRISVRPLSLLGGAAKLFFVAAVVVGLAPPLRQRAAPHVEPVLTPIRRLTVKDRVDRVSAFVEVEARITGLAPQERDLARVLRKMFPGREDVLVDPWGTRFYLRRRGDSFHVVSAGPDRRRGTADDITSNQRPIPARGRT